MSSTDMEKLNIILAVRNREFDRAMERSTKRIERFERKGKKSLSRTSRHFDAVGFAAKRLGPLIALLGAGAVIGKLKRTTAALDDIGKTADKIGLTTDALQELRAIAESAGVAQGSLDSSLERFSKRIGEAALGTGAANKALKEMGISADDLASMGLDKALAVVADKMADISDPTERAARAAALFGREGVAMVNLMREGSAGMEKMRAEARELGIVIDENLVRGAEDAQTKLDLMSRVIDAQLNSALIELAPLLVGGATAIADFARGLVSAIDAVKAFMNPQSLLETATENLVIAMADEIRQSQLLEVALGRGINMSVEAAHVKLEEARARHENAKAAVAEQRAIALGGETYQGLSDEIRRTNEDIAEMESVRDRASEMGINLPGLSSDDATHAGEIAAAYGRLNDAIQRRHKIKLTDDRLDEQLARTTENLNKLKTALENQKGGVVSIEGSYVTPIENSPKDEIKSTGSAASVAIPELTDYEAVMDKIRAVFGNLKGSGDGFADTMAKLQILLDTGEISAEQYADAVDAIGQKFEDTKSAAENMERATEQMFIGIIDGSKNAKEAVADLLKQFASMALNSAFKGMFGGLFDGISGFFSSPVSGYSKGGYTGSGGRMTPAGVVHKGEYVFDQAATRRIGVGNLQALQTGGAQAMGGNARQSMGGGSVVINQHFSFSANGDDSVLRIIQGEMSRIADVTKAAVLDANRRHPSGGSF